MKKQSQYFYDDFQKQIKHHAKVVYNSSDNIAKIFENPDLDVFEKVVQMTTELDLFDIRVLRVIVNPSQLIISLLKTDDFIIENNLTIKPSPRVFKFEYIIDEVINEDSTSNGKQFLTKTRERKPMVSVNFQNKSFRTYSMIPILIEDEEAIAEDLNWEEYENPIKREIMGIKSRFFSWINDKREAYLDSKYAHNEGWEPNGNINIENYERNLGIYKPLIERLEILGFVEEKDEEF